MLQETDHRKTSTMAFNLHLSLLVLATVLMTEYLTSACNISIARESAQQSLFGGWRVVAVDDANVVQLRQSVANDAIVARAHYIIESYQQVGHNRARTRK